MRKLHFTVVCQRIRCHQAMEFIRSVLNSACCQFFGVRENITMLWNSMHGSGMPCIITAVPQLCTLVNKLRMSQYFTAGQYTFRHCQWIVFSAPLTDAGQHTLLSANRSKEGGEQLPLLFFRTHDSLLLPHVPQNFSPASSILSYHLWSLCCLSKKTPHSLRPAPKNCFIKL